MNNNYYMYDLNYTKRTKINIELHESKNNNLTELEEFDEFIKIKNKEEYLEVIKKYNELCRPHKNKPNEPNKRLNKYGESCEILEIRNKQECDYILNKLKKQYFSSY